MSVQPRLLTAEEFAALPNDGLRMELVRGELIVMPPTLGNHGDAVGSLHSYLGYHIKTHQLGKIYGAETGFLIARDPDTVRAPDIAFIAASRVTPAVTAPTWVPIVPDLVVEVVSNYDRDRQIAEKVQMWLDAGVRLIWVVYPMTQTVAVHAPGRPPRTLTRDDQLDGEDIVPGFTVGVGYIFI